MPGGSWRPIGGKGPPHWPTATEAADPATLFLTMRQLRWSSWPASPTLAPTTLTSPSCCGIGKALTSAAGSGVGPVRGREVPDPGVGSHASAIAHAPGTVERRTHDYLRHGTVALFAALHTGTGRVIGRCHQRRRGVEFRKFLDTIEAEVPADLDVHLIADNYATHQTALIRNWLAKRPRFRSAGRRCGFHLGFGLIRNAT